MDADHLFIGHGLQAQRIGVAQVGLLGEGQLLEVFLGVDGGQVDAGEFLRVEGTAVLEGFELLLDEGKLLVGHAHGGTPFCNSAARCREGM